MNNEVRDGFGRLIGFRCWQCDEIKTKMWGEICNSCRAQNEHAALLRAFLQSIPANTQEGGKP